METTDRAPIVLDLRRQKAKRVKQLCKGTGPLLAEIGGALEELRQSGGLPADATPVVVVVREKEKRARPAPPPPLGAMIARRILFGR